MPSIDFTIKWFEKARNTAKAQGKVESAMLWQDGLTALQTLEAENARMREALELLALNFNLVREPLQPYRDVIDSWHYIARAALEGEP